MHIYDRAEHSQQNESFWFKKDFHPCGAGICIEWKRKNILHNCERTCQT